MRREALQKPKSVHIPLCSVSQGLPISLRRRAKALCASDPQGSPPLLLPRWDPSSPLLSSAATPASSPSPRHTMFMSQGLCTGVTSPSNALPWTVTWLVPSFIFSSCLTFPLNTHYCLTYYAVYFFVFFIVFLPQGTVSSMRAGSCVLVHPSPCKSRVQEVPNKCWLNH